MVKNLSFFQLFSNFSFNTDETRFQMLQKLLSHITKSLILTFFALGSVCPVLLAQEDIGGIINSYARVTSTGPGYVTVLPAQASQFLADDYVLLIQMQGVGITTVSGSYGITVQQTFGTPGGC